MSKCDKCGEEISMPYKCKRCNHDFCSKHRLPENHQCPLLNRGGKNSKEIKAEIKKEQSKENRKLPTDTIINKIEGWKLIMIAIGFSFIAQILTVTLFSSDLHTKIFVLHTDNLFYFWTYITSLFSHSLTSPMHIIGNAIVLFFFGRLLEKIIGRRPLLVLFIGAGIIAAISEVLLAILLGNTTGVLGASGGILALMGVLTVYNPKMKVYLYFIIPIPLWVITIGYIVFSIVATVSMGEIMGNIAHMAHLSGLLIGIIYGYKTQHKYNIPNKIKRI